MIVTKQSEKLSREPDVIRARSEHAQASEECWGPEHQQPFLTPSRGQAALSTVLQGLGVVAAIAFGVYAIKAVQVSTIANTLSTEALLQAQMANQLALLSICSSNFNEVRPISLRTMRSAQQWYNSPLHWAT